PRVGPDPGWGGPSASVPHGRQATIAFFHANELIGATAIVSWPPRITIQVVVKSTLTSLDLHKARALASTENQVATAIAVHLSACARKAARVIAVRSLGDIKQRLAYDLLDRACQAQLVVG